MGKSKEFEIENGTLIRYKGKDKDVVIPDGMTIIGKCAFSQNKELHSVVIPDSVTKIEEYAFRMCTNLKNVIIPKSVTEIGDFAFNESGITEITIPGNITKLGWAVFAECNNLENVIISDGVTEIGRCSFYKCKTLRNISIPASVNCIGGSAFLDTEFLSEKGVWENGALYLNDWLIKVKPECKYLTVRQSTKIISGDLYGLSNKPELTELTIPNGVISIGEDAFKCCCQLKHVFIPESVEHIGYNAFGKQSLESIVVDSKNKCYDSRNNCNAIIDSRTNELIQGCRFTDIPSDIAEIGNYAFFSSDFKKIISIPDGVTRIGDYALAGCIVSDNLNLPEGLEIIGNNAFRHCDTIKNIVIPKSVSKIGSSAFENCNRMETLTIGSDNVIIGGNTFRGCCSLKNIDIKGKIDKDLDPHDFDFTRLKKFSLSDKTYSAGIKIDAKFADYLNPTEYQLACLITFQSGKKWQDFFDKSVNENNADGVISHCIDLLRQTEKVSSKLAETVSQIAIRFYNSVGIVALKELSEVLSEKKKESADLVKTISSLENGENLDELAQKYTVVQTKVIDIEKAEIIVSGSKIGKLPFDNIVDVFTDKIAEKREHSGYLKLKNISFLGLKSKNTEMYFGNGCLQKINLILNIDCFSKLLRKLESEIDKKYEGRKDTIYYESEKMIIAGSPVDDDIELRIMFL